MTATEVNQKHSGATGQRSLGRDNPIKRGLAGSIKLSSDANLGTPCYYLPVGGFDQVKVIAEKDPEAMAMLSAAIPGFDAMQPRDELRFDPAYDVEYKKFVDPITVLSRLVLVSIHQRPGKPKPPVVLPAWAHSIEEVMHYLAEWNAGEAWAKEVFGADLSTWPATREECKAKLDANRIQPPPRPTEPAVVQEKEAQPVSEIPFEPTRTDELAEELDEAFGPKRVIWSADTSKPGQSQNIAAWKHFEREVWAIDESLVPPKELPIALAPYKDIPTAIDTLGWPVTRQKLQARLDYLKAHKSTQVDAKENTVTDNAGLASTALTAKDWADFLKGKCKSADMLKALGLNKLSEWHGTLEDAYTIYLTKTTPVVPPDEDVAPNADGIEPDESEDINEMEAGYADPEPPAALAPVAQVDAIATPKGELIVMPRDPNKAILHVKSTKALVDHMFNDKVLIAGVDYGTIAGGRQDAKPSLLKPGAEKLLDAFQFYPVFKPTSNSHSDWTGMGFFNFEYEAVICDRVTGRIEGSGIGSCNSKESKYRYRWLYDNEAKAQGFNLSEMISKTYPKKGGGTYTKYRVDNEDIFDIVNTLSKMAQKRALVAATLNATGASAVFTQDGEDFADFGLVD